MLLLDSMIPACVLVVTSVSSLMIAVIFLVETLVSSAKERISSATTAKPC